MQRLAALVDTLLERKEELPYHRQRDQTNRLVRPARCTWHLALIRSMFPDEVDTGFGSSLRRIVSEHVTTVDDLWIIPRLKSLAPYVAASESMYFSLMHRAMTRLFLDNKSEAFLTACREAWRQTAEEKLAERRQGPNTLSARLTNPIEFDLTTVLSCLRDNVDSEVFAHQGVLLELALGCRSIDLLNPFVMTCSSNQTSCMLTGHSKVRGEAQWEEAKQTVLEVTPVGLLPDEAQRMLARYRQGLPELIASFQPPTSLTPLQRMQFINQRLSLKFTNRLAQAARQLFPEQAARGGKFGSHTFRALHCACSYNLHGAGQAEDVFFKTRLQHADFGSVSNYKTVRLAPLGYHKELAAIRARLERLEDRLERKRKGPFFIELRP